MFGKPIFDSKYSHHQTPPFTKHSLHQNLCLISNVLVGPYTWVSVAMITASAQPYRVHSLNQAEQVSCNVNVIVLIFGYFFQLGIWSDTAIRAFATMCNVIIVVTIIVLLFYVALDTWQGVC